MNGIVGPNVAVWFHLGPLALSGYYLHPVRIHCVWAFVGSVQWSGGPNLFITGSAWPPNHTDISDHAMFSYAVPQGKVKRWCNMQLHTCQTVPRFVIRDEWSTEGNAIKCFCFMPYIKIPSRKYCFLTETNIVSEHPWDKAMHDLNQEPYLISISLHEAFIWGSFCQHFFDLFKLYHSSQTTTLCSVPTDKMKPIKFIIQLF